MEITLSEDDIKYAKTFFPFMAARTFTAIQNEQKFVHYCDADAALSMIEKGELWLRNTTWMNDTSEIEHGTKLLISAYSTAPGLELRKRLNTEWPGFTERFEPVFSSWFEHWRQETYIACLTELLPKEDVIGRLSMWRAYGKGSSPVAFVVNGGPMLRPSDALKAYTSAVAYLDQQEFDEQFAVLVENIVGDWEYIKRIGQDATFNSLFAAFRFAVICTKHPSFYEEREWRIIYQPTFQPSDRLIEDVKSIAGAPQRIFKIPMKEYPEEGFYGATLPDLLVRIIIGPGPNASNLYREFVRFLGKAGVSNAIDKVVVSNVPLRT
ncbi:hypothetical protein X731_02060 [Mesorhizobium sp. L2C054A000]|nr:DUF2971 domain-containing protein [Mesorhizobium sp. L2C054A000]ESZ53294.1 hypothetical protein X731_02060 [Mesorhizobium sp. L2C054A000]